MFQECLKDVSRKFQRRFMEISRMFQKCLRDVSRMFHGCFKGTDANCIGSWTGAAQWVCGPAVGFQGAVPRFLSLVGILQKLTHFLDIFGSILIMFLPILIIF